MTGMLKYWPGSEQGLKTGPAASAPGNISLHLHQNVNLNLVTITIVFYPGKAIFFKHEELRYIINTMLFNCGLYQNLHDKKNYINIYLLL